MRAEMPAKPVGNLLQIRIYPVVRLFSNVDAVCEHILEWQLNTMFSGDKKNSVSNV